MSFWNTHSPLLLAEPADLNRSCIHPAGRWPRGATGLAAPAKKEWVLAHPGAKRACNIISRHRLSRKDERPVLKLWGQLQELVPRAVKITVWLVPFNYSDINTDYSDDYCHPFCNFCLLLLDMRQQWLVHLLSQFLKWSNDLFLDNALDNAYLQCYLLAFLPWIPLQEIFSKDWLIVTAWTQPVLVPSKLLFFDLSCT